MLDVSLGQYGKKIRAVQEGAALTLLLFLPEDCILYPLAWLISHFCSNNDDGICTISNRLQLLKGVESNNN